MSPGEMSIDMPHQRKPIKTEKSRIVLMTFLFITNNPSGLVFSDHHPGQSEQWGSPAIGTDVRNGGRCPRATTRGQGSRKSYPYYRRYGLRRTFVVLKGHPLVGVMVPAPVLTQQTLRTVPTAS